MTTEIKTIRKKCSRCKIEQPLTGFYKFCKSFDGLTSKCKICYKNEYANLHPPAIMSDLPNEIWKPTFIYPEYYQVSNCGRVKSIRTGKIFKPGLRGIGYFAITLSVNGVTVQILVHRLVAIAFVTNPDGKPYVNHMDGNKLNNNPSNLEWCTIAENNRHANATGLSSITKLTETQVLKIRELPEGLTKTEIGKMFNVSSDCITAIIERRTWKHI